VRVLRKFCYQNTKASQLAAISKAEGVMSFGSVVVVVTPVFMLMPFVLASPVLGPLMFPPFVSSGISHVASFTADSISI
jgi:hypothetical protein